MAALVRPLTVAGPTGPHNNDSKAVYEAHFAKTIAWLLRTQAMLAGLAGLAFVVLSGAGAAIAALAGGLLGVVLTAVAALRLGMGGGGRSPEAMIQGFYRAMAIKLVMAVVLFIIVARWFPGHFGPVLTGYAATLVAYWVALLKLRVSDAN